VFEDDGSVATAVVRLLRSAGSDAETFSSADDFLNSPKQKKK
jgi:FixJ family two-component response regulator